MKVTRRGGPKMRPDAGERALLRSLLAELRVLLASGDEDAATERLFPAAYDDAEDAEAFRELTEATLRRERVQRIEECAAELAGAEGVVDVAGAAGDRWIRVINDLRLVLGTKLGVTEEWDHQVDPTDPEQLPQAAYVWLTAVQDSLVRALMN